MTRKTPAWMGARDETPPPTRVKARIVLRQDGVCACGCGVSLGIAAEGIEFDHIIALINGGQNCETNLQALRKPCHAMKTKADVAEKATVARKRAKHLGLDRPKATLPGSRQSKWKRTVDGRTIRRDA